MCIGLVLYIHKKGNTEEGESECRVVNAGSQSHTDLIETKGVCVCGGEEMEHVGFYLENHLLFCEVIPPPA